MLRERHVVRFSTQQKTFIAIWIIIGAYWFYAVLGRHDTSSTVWLGLLTVFLGILAQVMRPTNRPD